jgi:hypothetical protein
MPPLPGFSNNPFQTRSDFLTAALSLLQKLTPYHSPSNSLIRLLVSTGAHFDEVAAQLEGYARPLWVIGALLSLPAKVRVPLRSTKGWTTQKAEEVLQLWVRGITAGTDPDAEGFWGDVGDKDQRMVEMEILSFALLSAPEVFLPDPQTTADEKEKSEMTALRRNVTVWLASINRRGIPETNWLWFRVLTNLARIKSCGVPIQTSEIIWNEI